MNKNINKVLYIEDNQGDLNLLLHAVNEFPEKIFQFSHSKNLTDAEEKVKSENFDIVLLDLGLPESTGLDTLCRFIPSAGKIPIVVLTGMDDENGPEAIKLGAQDYIEKNNLQPSYLFKTLLFAIERKKNEQIIKKNLEHFRAVSENTNMIVCELDPQGNFIYVNPSFENQFGYFSSELYGRSFSILISENHAKFYLDEIKQLIYFDKPLKTEWQLNSKGGSENWFEVAGNILLDINGEKKILFALHQITEYKEKIDAAKNREKMFKNIADFSPMMIFASSKNKQFNYFNNSWLNFTGNDLKSQLGFGFSECIHPFDRLQFWNKYFSAFDNRVEFSVEFRLKKFDDTYGWIALNGIPNYYFENEFSGFLFSGFEITKRKEFEEKITASESLLKQVLEVLPAGVMIVDKDHNKVKCNKAFFGFNCAKQDYALNEIKLEDCETGEKKNLADLLNEVHQDEDKLIIKQLYKIQTDELKVYSLLSIIKLENAEGKFDGIIIVSEDITKIKMAEESLLESETLLTAIFREVPTPVFIATVNEGMIIDANTAFEKLSGFNLSYLIAKSVEELKILKDQNKFSEIVKVLLKQKFIKDFEVEFKNRTGNKGTALISARLLKIKNKICVVTVINDITENKENLNKIENYIKELQESKNSLEAKTAELAILNDDLNKTNANKDRFFSIIAHDLRSPFGSMLGISEFLVKHFDDISHEELKEFNFSLNNSLNRIFKLLENLLQWANLQSGRLIFKPGIFDLKDLTAQVIEILHPAAEEKFIKLKNEINTELPVYADKNMISTVLRNLISNAIKYTNSGGNVSVNAEFSDGKIQISVNDNGIGIPDEILEKLFKVEEKVTTLGTENEKGTGLGLILCKDFVEKHDGKIWAESNLNEGSTFTFTLPFMPES